MNIEEQNYLDLLKNILDLGIEKSNRTGIGTIGIFGTQLRFDLSNNQLPLITTKKMFTKGIIEELLFFLRGDTDTSILENKGINIWKGNTTREFLDSRGMVKFPEKSLGYGYGWQWRRWGATLESPNVGIDQLDILINQLKNNPNDRRMMVSAWNVSQIDQMALPPCHYNFQCYVADGKLSLMWNQRSVDSFLGLPFNIASYGILLHILAKTCNLKPGELIFSGGDTHVYMNHIEQVKLQISRNPYPFPLLKINKELSTLKDIENLELKDFEIYNYESHPVIKAEMAI